MAKIALRVYNNEISDLIDNGQINEAIAHSLHILELFPRHVDTYRLLGKAYLEGKQYREAADIFQRVLSSIPDDFIANVGMSIIREAEGNLPTAIYHMERTFERQPSNQAIQEELRRLYGKRDGIEPAKTRLTRGALARMYAYGNLYDQAAAELVAALSEEPQRLDLQVLLADLYFKLNKQDDAIDICSHILGILPNSITANRILYLLLKDGQRSDEAANYHKRWAAMAPYAAFISEAQSEPESVPDSMVTLERLTLDSDEAEFDEVDDDFWNTPDTGAGPTRTVEPIVSEEVPDWLKNTEGEQDFDSEEHLSDQDNVPDWLSDLGGVENEMPEENEAKLNSTDDASFTEAEETNIEVPAWLNSPANDAPTDKEETPVTPNDTWPEQEEDGFVQPEEQQAPLSQFSADETQQDDQSDENELLSAEDAEQIFEPTEEDIPDWMQELAKPRQLDVAEPTGWPAEPISEEEQVNPDAPAWLQDLNADKPVEEGGLDWLQETEPEEPKEENNLNRLQQTAADEKAADGGTPDLLADNGERQDVEEDNNLDLLVQPTTNEQAADSGTPDLLADSREQQDAEEDDSLDWLQQPVTNEEPTADDYLDRLQEPAKADEPVAPDWMDEIASGEETVDEGAKASTVPDSEDIAEDKAPEWMQDEDSHEAESDNTPLWLKDIGQQAATSEAPGDAPQQESEVEETEKIIDDIGDDLDWLEELGEPQHSQEEAEPGKDTWSELFKEDEDDKDSTPPPQPMKTASIADDADEDEDDALSWLSDLPSTSGLGTVPEILEDKDPNFDEELTDETASETEDIGGDETLAMELEIPKENKDMDGLETLAMEPETAQPEDDLLESDDLDWIDEVLIDDDLETPASSSPVPSADAEYDQDEDEDADSPAWLSALTEDEDKTTPDIETQQASPATDSPINPMSEGQEFEWIETPAPEPAKESDSEPVSENDDWLQSLLEEGDSLVAQEPGEGSEEGEEKETEESPQEITTEESTSPVLSTEAQDYSVLEEQSPEAWLDAFEEEADDEASPDLDEKSLDWLDNLDIEDEEITGEEPEPVQEKDTEPEAVDQQPEVPVQEQPASPTLDTQTMMDEIQQQGEEPEWLKSLNEEEEEDKPSWLKNLNQARNTGELVQDTASDEVDEWLKYLSEPVQTPTSEAEESVHEETHEETKVVEETEEEAEEVVESEPTEQITPPVEKDIAVDNEVEAVQEEEAEQEETPPLSSITDLDETIKKYSYMIRKGRDLEKIVESLQEALHHYPMDARLWQILGDAHMRLDRLQEALDAYTQAENLLR